MLNTISITPNRLTSLLPTMVKSKYPIYLSGQPGIGKSQIVRAFAEKNNLKLYDVRLTQIEAADLRGLPMIDEVNNVTRWLRPEFLPVEGEVEAEGYAGSIIFLDELSSAEGRLQASSYQLILDRKVGEYKLPDSCYVLGAGNSVEDSAIAYELSSALRDRLIFFKVVAEPQSWLKWAEANNIAKEVLTFIKVKPEYLYGTQGSAATEVDHDIIPTPRKLTICGLE